MSEEFSNNGGNMIFVAVGTQKFQLNRLLKAIDNLIEKGQLKEEVFAQIGNSNYIPKKYSYKKIIAKEEFELNIRQCDLLITHSGVGTIITGITYHKPIIVFPRLSKFQEHVDDHQVQIAKAFSTKGLVITCDNTNELMSAIEQAKTFTFQNYCSQRENVIKEIRTFISKQSER